MIWSHFQSGAKDFYTKCNCPVQIVCGLRACMLLLLIGGRQGKLPSPTCHDVVVACQIFGGGVDDDVSAEGDGALVDGRGECGVDAHQRARSVAQPRNGRHVHAAQVRVCGRLREEQAHLLRLQRPLQPLHNTCLLNNLPCQGSSAGACSPSSHHRQCCAELLGHNLPLHRDVQGSTANLISHTLRVGFCCRCVQVRQMTATISKIKCAQILA